jgi:hypothetical protein
MVRKKKVIYNLGITQNFQIKKEIGKKDQAKQTNPKLD